MLRKLFGKKGKPLAEPVFPKENYSIFKLDLEEGWALATINTGYDHYPNKRHFPWQVQVEVDINEKNENGHPTNDEAVVLNDVEELITTYLRKSQQVHPIGRVTRNGARDIIYYIDEPKLDEEETKRFFDEVNTIRNMNVSIQHDPDWELMQLFIK